MNVKRLYAIAALLAAVPLNLSWGVQAEPAVPAASESSQSKPTLEELKAKRRTARQDLMLDSLRGIRGLAYGAIHDDKSAELEKTMVLKLKQLNIPLHPFSTLKPGVKPVDALLEIKVSRAPNADYVQLNLFQWVSLLRQPKTEVRAVTYHDAMLSDDADLDKTVEQLTDQFAIDVLKANQISSSARQANPPVKKKR